MLEVGVEVRLIVIDLKNNVFKPYIGPARSFLTDFKMDKGLQYDVGMDQSNSCTGITLESLDHSILIMMEVVNGGVAYKYYRNALVKILHHLLKDLTVRYFVMEKPLPYISGKRNKALNELKKLLEEFIKTETSLHIENFAEEFPQSWRSGLIKKDNPHDKRSKSATVHEIKKLYPFIDEFIKITYNPTDESGYDGIESCGIINGYRKRHEIEDGGLTVKIVGPKNTTKVALSIFFYEDSKIENLKKIINLIMEYNPKLGQPKVKYYNEEEGVYANSKMSLVDNFTVTTITKTIDVIAILHLFGLKEVIGNELQMIVIPLNSLKPNFSKLLVSNRCNMEVFY